MMATALSGWGSVFAGYYRHWLKFLPSLGLPGSCHTRASPRFNSSSAHSPSVPAVEQPSLSPEPPWVSMTGLIRSAQTRGEILANEVVIREARRHAAD